MKLGLWKRTAGCSMRMESAKQMENSPRILLPSSVKYQSHFAGSTAKESQWGARDRAVPRLGHSPALGL